MKKKHKLRRILLILSVLLLISLLTFGSYWLYKNIFFPSYLSVISSCNKEKFEEEYSDYYVAGEIIVGKKGGNLSIEEVDFEDLNITIKIYDNDTDKELMKHECVHYAQLLRGFPSLHCDNYIQKFIGENEAYLISKLPDKIYIWIYGDECFN